MQRFLGLGGRVDHGRAALVEQLAQFRAQFLAQLVVEVDQRLVEQQQAGVLDERAGDRGALLLASRQLRRMPLEQVVDAQQFGGCAHLALDLRRIEAPRLPQRRGDVAEHRQRGIVDELLVHHRHVARAHADAGHVRPVDKHVARCRPVESRHDAHEGRFAGARRAEQRVQGAGRERQRDIAQELLPADPQADLLKR